MRPSLAAAALVAWLAAAPIARAGEPVLALRLAVAPAVGSVARDVPISDALSLHVPVQLDALWREGPIAAGLYGSWGIARYKGCRGASCSASVTRLGVQATWSFEQLSRAEPWAGIGAGYEWASASRTRDGASTDTSWRGFELFEVQGGAEWRVARRLAVGPFVLVGLGRYARLGVDTGFQSASADIADRAVHAWIHVGVRGRLVLGDRT